jgi:hypothetical protein
MPQQCDQTAVISARPPIVVQILGMLLFGGFAIVATVLAFVAFLPAGFALAVILAIYGFGPMLSQRDAKQDMNQSKSLTPEPVFEYTGNSSFDAYRANVLHRLEDEQKTFVSFLDRLRDAKSKSEFDAFMADRARIAADATDLPPLPADAPPVSEGRAGAY